MKPPYEMLHEEQSQYSVQIVLATMPQKQEDYFDKSVKKNYFEKYRRESLKYYNTHNEEYGTITNNNGRKVKLLYNPLRYYIFGNYDIAYISLIDNLKFAQRLFEPQLGQKNVKKTSQTLGQKKTRNITESFSPHSFQSFTGLSLNTTEELTDFFSSHVGKKPESRPYFLAVCNLKLNNGFLIGNGSIYLKSTNDFIRDKVREINEKKKTVEIAKSPDKQDHLVVEGKAIQFLILQSFSWFEISLMLFASDTGLISELLTTIRKSKVDDLPEKLAFQIKENSLCNGLLEQRDKAKLGQANIFADSQSHIGLHADLADLPENNSFVKRFMASEPVLNTRIECQVKPGHLHMLETLIFSSLNQNHFEEKIRSMIIGKSDYQFSWEKQFASNNLRLIRYILKNGQNNSDENIFDHVRKIKTKVIFERDTEEGEHRREVLHLDQFLERLSVTTKEAIDANGQLKELKVSRQIRSKVLKIFSNYNNGIQDIILFNYFLDFKIFIEELIKMIAKEKQAWDGYVRMDHPLSDADIEQEAVAVRAFEERLLRLISIFEEGFAIRMLNCYQFEDITDFDLDFNSSIQQLLSSYSALIAEIGNLFYKEKYKYGPVVQLNLQDTVANYNSINYYIHHLTSPEFVYATIIKEILNFNRFDTDKYLPLQKAYRECKPLSFTLLPSKHNNL
jgi:hypothetical protein